MSAMCLLLTNQSVEEAVFLERVMHFERWSQDMDTEIERHSHVSGDPAHGKILDSRLRGNDHMATSTLCQYAEVHNTL